MNEKMKALDLKLQKLVKDYYTQGKREQGYFIDKLWNDLQDRVVRINKDLNALDAYFDALIEGIK